METNELFQSTVLVKVNTFKGSNKKFKLRSHLDPKFEKTCASLREQSSLMASDPNLYIPAVRFEVVAGKYPEDRIVIDKAILEENVVDYIDTGSILTFKITEVEPDPKYGRQFQWTRIVSAKEGIYEKALKSGHITEGLVAVAESMDAERNAIAERIGKQPFTVGEANPKTKGKGKQNVPAPEQSEIDTVANNG